jgi:hypothetical protein
VIEEDEAMLERVEMENENENEEVSRCSSIQEEEEEEEEEEVEAISSSFNNKKRKRKKGKKKTPEIKQSKFINYPRVQMKQNPCWKLYRNNLQATIENAIESLLIPSSYRQQFVAKSIFSQSGNLNGQTVINIVEVFMQFICYIIETNDRNYPKGYLDLFRMISEDFACLLSPRIRKTDIEKLQAKITETVNFWGKMFPASEQQFVIHEVLELVQTIRIFGPLRGWWTLPGERAIAFIKTSLPHGGATYYATTVNRQVRKEFSRLRKSYKFTSVDIKKRDFSTNREEMLPPQFVSYENESLQFSDLTMILFGLRGNAKYYARLRSDFELIGLYDCLVDSIFGEASKGEQEQLNLFQNSMFYRMAIFYHYYLKPLASKEIEETSFYLWLIALYTNDEYLNQLKTEFTFCEDNLEDLTNIEIRSKVQNGGGSIFLSDINNLSQILITKLRVAGYTKAFVLGTKFMARGQEYREENEPEPKKRHGIVCRNVPRETVNKHTPREFCSSKQMSSWCKFRLFKHSKTYTKLADENGDEYYIDKFESKDCVGQLNFFFRITFENEPFISKLPLASITCRKSKIVPRSQMHVIDCDNLMNYQPDCRFISLQHIYSSPIMISCFDNNGKFLDESKLLSMSKRPLVNSFTKFLTIDMMPHRMELRTTKTYVPTDEFDEEGF